MGKYFFYKWVSVRKRLKKITQSLNWHLNTSLNHFISNQLWNIYFISSFSFITSFIMFNQFNQALIQTYNIILITFIINVHIHIKTFLQPNPPTSISYESQSTLMQLPSPTTSPFREKIFSLMNQQHPSKVIKLSQKMQNKTINTTHSPFKEYSIDTDLADSHKLTGLDSSSGVNHFKSLQDKLGLKNVSNEKSRGKLSSSKSSGKEASRKMIVERDKKVSFVDDNSKFYYKPSKSKSKSRPKSSIKKQLSKSSSTYKHRHLPSPKSKPITKFSSNKSLNKANPTTKISQTLTQNPRKPFDSTYVDSSEKQTQKKNYLLQTLRKMESVRKNLTKTFEQFDQEQNSRTGRIDDIKGEKEKSKSNLTVISDFVNEESQSVVSYGVRKGVQKKMSKSKSKRRLFQQSSRKPSKGKSPTTEIFHKKTPSKNRYLNSHQSLTEQSINTQTSLLPKSLIKQIILSSKHPQKWQTLLANDLISVHFRIVKRKLIQIEIHAQQGMSCLEIELQKGSLVCQSLKEKYENVRKKEIITLLCSVRGMNVGIEGQGVFQVPKLLVKIYSKLQENSITFRKQVDLPYTWLMLIQKDKKQKAKHSSYKKHQSSQILCRVKTRSTLQDIELPKGQKHSNLLQILSFCQVKPQKQKSPKKQKKTHNSSSTTKLLSVSSAHKVAGNDRYLYVFELDEQEFRLGLKLNYSLQNASKRNTYDLELEGKGEALMSKLLLFLQLLS